MPLSRKRRDEWSQLFMLSEEHYRKNVVPTEKFVAAYKNPGAHWKDIRVDSAGNTENPREWPYHQATANFIYANTQTVLPQVLLRDPKVFVRPAAKLTRLADRIGEISPEERMRNAFLVQELENWRVREFAFRKAARKAVVDDDLRGFGVIRHGFAAERDVEHMIRGKRRASSYHEQIRPGWPYAVHCPLERFRFDPVPDCPEEWQWISFADFWRIEDLRADSRFTVPKNFANTHLVGVDDTDSFDLRVKLAKENEVLGRVLLWETWDKRTEEVFWWVPGLNREIRVEPWPLEWEGLPATVLQSNVFGVTDANQIWELQQELNRLLSLLLVYAQRGAPTIAVQENAMDEEEINKLVDSEIQEILKTKGVPENVIKQLQLQPLPQTILAAAQFVLDMIRQVTGIGRMSRGSRENVESAQEAFAIQRGESLRQSDRIVEIRDFLSRMVRKDWQTLRQTPDLPRQILDLADTRGVPQLFQVPADAIKMEYDFEIQVGSTEEDSDLARKRNALAFLEAASHPTVAAHFDAVALAEKLTRDFGEDVGTFLSNPEAVRQRVFNEKLQELAFGQGKRGANGRSLGAALDASKQTRDNAGGMQG